MKVEGKNGPMLYLGKALATIGVWAACGAVGYFSISYIIIPLAALYAGVVGTVAIWCSEKLEDVLP